MIKYKLTNIVFVAMIFVAVIFVLASYRGIKESWYLQKIEADTKLSEKKNALEKLRELASEKTISYLVDFLHRDESSFGPVDIIMRTEIIQFFIDYENKVMGDEVFDAVINVLNTSEDNICLQRCLAYVGKYYKHYREKENILGIVCKNQKDPMIKRRLCLIIEDGMK
jgi:hypothetical protein